MRSRVEVRLETPAQPMRPDLHVQFGRAREIPICFIRVFNCCCVYYMGLKVIEELASRNFCVVNFKNHPPGKWGNPLSSIMT